jgi:hypothetical protein
MRNKPFNEASFNVGNSIFPGYNDKHGIVICGYEYGYNSKDRYLENNFQEVIIKKASNINTFFNKSAIYNSPYDLRIIKWFNFFGHPLGANEGNSEFDKCILQTNWCNSQDTYVSNYNKFLLDENINNFICHMDEYRPSILIFMGSKQIKFLQNEKVFSKFEKIFGKQTHSLRVIKKNFSGRRFNIAFQELETIKVVSLPHPSGSRGLSDEYIKLFKPEICQILEQFKKSKWAG